MGPLVDGPAEGRFSQGTVLQVGGQSCVVQRFLSAGGHANVYLVTLLQDGTSRVLKHIPFGGGGGDEGRRQQAEREIQYATQLSGHANVVALEAAEVAGDGAFVLMEHCSGDVLSLMNASPGGALDEATIVHIFCDVCKAVAHMHYQEAPLLHRDLKVENVLSAAVGDRITYKLCDFGSATADTVAPDARLAREQIVAMEDEIQRMTTLEYRAPEMVDLYLRRGITEKADVWALGVLLYKLCYFKTPFDGASSLAILNAEYSVPPLPAYSDRLRHIFQMTLREEPRERPNIYTLCTYVCALRGEPCLLENKYASPPLSPYSELVEAQQQQQQQQRKTQRDGLGCVRAQPLPQPRRYAGSSSNSGPSSRQPSVLFSSRPGSGTTAAAAASDPEPDRVAPMRRGRPAKAQNAQPAARGITGPPRFSASASVGGRLQLPEGGGGGGAAAAQPAPRAPRPVPAPFRRAAAGGSASPDAARAEAAQPHTGSRGGSDEADRSGASEDDAPLRMSVRALDGRQSLSEDFVQGAVFGSARRTSLMMRRNPSVVSSHSTASSSRASARSGLRISHDAARHSSGSDASDDPLPMPAIDGIPGFVRQPLPPPPPPPPPLGPDHLVPAAAKPDEDLPLGAMISPMSLPDMSPGAASAGGDEDDGLLFPDHAAGADAHPAGLRLSTILELQPDDGGSGSGDGGGRRPRMQQRQREYIQSIYEMTLDKLESELRLSTVFDDEPLFDGAGTKARYAAQRSSVYQPADSQPLDADWDAIPADAKDSMLRMIDSHRDALDADTVLQRAEQRNRQKLIAQNNRRSMYISGAAAGSSNSNNSNNNSSSSNSGAGGLLQEDVDANMRVLTEHEIEALLKKMDMYNRELLLEQQRWRTLRQPASSAAAAATPDMWSLDRILEHANDHMLRTEQEALPPKAAESAAPSSLSTTVEPDVPGSLSTTVKPDVPSSISDGAPSSIPGDVAEQLDAPKEPAATAPAAVAPAPAEPQPASTPGSPVQPLPAPEAGVGSSADPPEAGSTASASTPAAPPEALPAVAPADPKSDAGADPSTAAAKTPPPPAANTPRDAAVPDTAPAGKTAADAVTPTTTQPAGPPSMARARSDTVGKAAAPDPLADLRARLKKKKSSPALPSAAPADRPQPPPPRAAFLDHAAAKTRAGALPASPARGTKSPGSVKNLVAMFEKP